MPTTKLPSSRTLKPDAGAIRRLRQAKGWRVEDLARKAKCSVKTIENVERGANVYYFTLSKLADALGVDFDSLTPDHTQPDFSGHVAAESKSIVFVQIKISKPYDQFDESEQLINLIRSLCSMLKFEYDVGVVRVDEGSTIIVTQMHHMDAKKLRRDSQDDFPILSALNVIAIRHGLEPDAWRPFRLDEFDKDKGETAS